MELLVSDLVGKRLPEIPVVADYARPHPHTSVGIEVELENIRAGNIPPLKRWQKDTDGSLQGGVEFISDPVWGTAISEALEELRMALLTEQAIATFRTSVHIHLNVLDMTAPQLIRLLELYIMYEPALFRLHQNWNRSSCLFCVPVHSSVRLQQNYGRVLSDIQDRSTAALHESYKYSGLNLRTVNTLGTIEFRQMGGTDDMNCISDWINVILQLKVAALLKEPMEDSKEVWGEYHSLLDIHDEDYALGRKALDYINLWRDS